MGSICLKSPQRDLVAAQQGAPCCGTATKLVEPVGRFDANLVRSLRN